MITKFKIFENEISDSMWSKLVMASSSPSHYLKPSVLKDGTYVVGYREKYLDGLLLQFLGLNKNGGTKKIPYYNWKVIDEINWSHKNGDYRVGRTHSSYGPQKELDTILYIGRDIEEAKAAFQSAKETVAKLKTINSFDL